MVNFVKDRSIRELLKDIWAFVSSVFGVLK